MSPGDAALLIMAAASVATVVMTWRSGSKIDDTKKILNEYHLSVNSKMDRYIELVDAAAHAKGVIEGRKDTAG